MSVKHVWISIMAGLLLAGCMQEDEEPEGPPDGRAVFQNAQIILRSGDTNAALALIEGALDEPAYGDQRPHMFRGFIALLSDIGRVDEARTRYLAALTDHPDRARRALGVIYSHYRRAGDHEGVLDWTAALQAAGLPADMEGVVFAWRVIATVEGRPMNETLALVPVILERLDENGAARQLGDVTRLLLGKERFDDLDSLVAAVEQQGGDRAALRRLVAVTRVDAAVKRGAWDGVVALFETAAGQVDEREAAGLLSRVCVSASDHKRFDVADALCERVLTKMTAKTQIRDRAARQWVRSCRKRGRFTEVPGRLSRLRDCGVPAGQIFRLASDDFFAVVKTEDKQALTAMMTVVEALEPDLDEKDAGGARGLLLDAAFMLDDYDRAIKVLEKGVPERDADWHTMALNKVRAHRALKDGNIKEAVQRFRAFMVYIAEKAEPEMDPATGITHSPLMTLGFNAKRIGDLLAEAGDAGEAAAAYAEARSHYEQARKEAGAESPEIKWIDEQMAAIPAAAAAAPAPEPDE
jgi:tetratricopeptide (TPR) repeat protein